MNDGCGQTGLIVDIDGEIRAGAGGNSKAKQKY